MADKWLSEQKTREELDPILDKIRKLYSNALLENLKLMKTIRELKEKLWLIQEQK